MNWIFVSQYWGLLLDFGQVSPTTFRYSPAGNLIDYGPVRYPATNNIFVNDTLFYIYSNYLYNTILRLFGYHFPQFNPLNSTNKMNATDVSFKMLYCCQDLQLKSSESLVISILVADWAFMTSLYTIILFAGTWWEMRKNHGESFSCICIDDRELLSRCATVVGKREANNVVKTNENGSSG